MTQTVGKMIIETCFLGYNRMCHIYCSLKVRGIYSSICADAHRHFAGEKCGQNVMKKWSLGKKAVTTNENLSKLYF